jgi:hypothetical protein
MAKRTERAKSEASLATLPLSHSRSRRESLVRSELRAHNERLIASATREIIVNWIKWGLKAHL